MCEDMGEEERENGNGTGHWRRVTSVDRPVSCDVHLAASSIFIGVHILLPGKNI
jgi:hypothetical protein